MRLSLQTKSLRQTTLPEFTKRFVFGGLVTVAATLIAEKWGPVIGGLFIAFPGIFPAGVSLVEKHKTNREMEEGKQGRRSARAEASVEAAGASAGALGLAAFGIVIWKEMAIHPILLVLACAMLAWLLVAWLAWLLREKQFLLRPRKHS